MTIFLSGSQNWSGLRLMTPTHIFCFNFFAVFPNFGNVSFCCLKDLNRVRGQMVTLNNEVYFFPVRFPTESCNLIG